MSAWDAEYAPPNLVALGRQVRDAFNLVPVAIGTKGDEFHLYGYHRSRTWIMQDGDGADDYSVQLTLDAGGDGNWVSALDISLDEARMRACTAAMIAALRSRDPRVSAVREVYGTVDGRNVTGFDAANGSFVTSDDSHLWHLHLSFYRSRANNDHSGVLAVLKGEGTVATGDEDFAPYGRPAGGGGRNVGTYSADLWGQEINGKSPYDGATSARTKQLQRIEDGVKALVDRPAVSVDAAAVAAALQPVIAKAVADELAKRLES